MTRSKRLRRRRTPERRFFLVLITVLIATEFAVLCATIAVTGHHTASQFVGILVTALGAVCLVRGERHARTWMAALLLALAAYGAYHMFRWPHRVSVHSVGLVAQSIVRGVVGGLLFSSPMRRFVTSARDVRRHR